MDHFICVDKIKVILGSVQEFDSQSVIVVFGLGHSAYFNGDLEYFMLQMDQYFKSGVKRETHFSCFYEHPIFRDVCDRSCIISVKTGKPYLER